jgi:hypothetical protein
VSGEDLGQVVADKPELAERPDVHRCQQHTPTGDAQQLAESLVEVVPVLEAEHRHRGVDRLILEGQRFRNRLDGWSSAQGSLGDHDA